MSWYRNGTVTVQNGSVTVTGAGTAWNAGAKVSEGFKGPDGQLYEILSINADTQLTLGSPYLGANAAGQSYVIVPTQAYLRDLDRDVQELITEFGGVVDGVGKGLFPAGTALAPSVRGLADQDTGMNLPGGNLLQLITAGAVRMQFDSVGGANIPGSLSTDGALVAGGRLTAVKGSDVFTSVPSTAAGQATLSVRELNASGAQGNAATAAPRLSIFWGGVYGGQISCDAQGLKMIDEPGTGWAPLRVGTMIVNGQLVVSSASNSWFGMDAATTGASYGVFYKAGTNKTQALGYLGGASSLVSGASADDFAITTNTNLVLGAGTGVVRPALDNAIALGQAAYRFLSINLGTSPIVTSDARKKTDVQASLGLDFILKLKPSSYRLADSKNEQVEIPDGMEEVDEAVYEDVPVERQEVLIVDGKPVLKTTQEIQKRQVVDKVAVVDETGRAVMEIIPAVIDADGAVVTPQRSVPLLHPVPRTQRVRRAKTKTETRSTEGTRRHHGLLAQQVAGTLAALGLTGTDFAGLIRDEESDTWGLRYEQFIAPLISAVQTLSDRAEALSLEVQGLKAAFALKGGDAEHAP